MADVELTANPHVGSIGSLDTFRNERIKELGELEVLRREEIVDSRRGDILAAIGEALAERKAATEAAIDAKDKKAQRRSERYDLEADIHSTFEFYMIRIKNLALIVNEKNANRMETMNPFVLMNAVASMIQKGYTV